jgi:predicted aspartyl protease/Tfp pilus assembly protein PilF
MRRIKIALLTALVILAGRPRLTAEARTTRADIEPANSSFKAGQFAAAEKLCADLLARDQKDVQALILMGRLALLSNRLEEAQRWLTRAVRLDPAETKAKSLLAESYYRRDDFQRAAPLYRAIGREALATKLESFKGMRPYQIEDQAQTASLKFVQTDPLPVIRVRVNNSEEVNFIVDTGGPEVIIDPEFARSVGALQFGAETGTFAGGRQSAYQQGRVDSLTLGDFKVKNVPVLVQPTRQLAQVAGGKRVDGIFGTVLLYHFLAILDYPRGKLTLQRRTKENLKRMAQGAPSANQTAIPFWLAGDHYMVAWGNINHSQPLLLFVDTGAAGVGLTCPDSTIKEADIKLLEGQAGEGVGGGGRIKITPFVVDELTLGAATERKIVGLAGAFPPTLENTFGFCIGGLISHSFFRPYAVTFDFTGMRLFLKRKDS